MHDLLTDYPALLTVPEVAALLRVDPSYVYRLIRAGRLPGLRPTPHKTRVLKADLRRFLEAARPTAAAVTPLPATARRRARTVEA